ncbi:MAG: serine/threonine-protein kinase [Planctomycetota bacterium]
MTDEREPSEADLEATIQSAPPGGAPEEHASPPADDGTLAGEVDRTHAGDSASRGPRPVPKQRPDEYVPQIPDVSVTTQLGVGGQGVVFRGHQEYIDRPVAVKVLHRHVDPSFSRRFQREAKILAGLQHPNIVTCHQAGVTDDDHCYMVMEFIDGPDLCGYVEEHGALAECDALDVVRDVALALEHGLEASIIHRDVKPQNVLLQTHSGAGGATLRAKLTDLGLARCTEDNAEMPNLTTQGAVMGTPTTMAPEQFDSPDDVDHRTDIYGLGCVLYHALTGKRAFEGATMTEIYRKKTARDSSIKLARVAGATPCTRGLLERMVAPKPEDRHQTYRELLDEIEQARCGKAQRSRTPAAMIGVAAGLALVVGAMAGLGVFDGAESEEPASAASASDEDRQLASSTATAAVPSEVEETPEPASKETPPLELDPPVPAEGIRLIESWRNRARLVDDWEEKHTDGGQWWLSDGDAEGLQSEAAPDQRHTATFRCPEGAWSLSGRVRNGPCFPRPESGEYRAGVRLLDAGGRVLVDVPATATQATIGDAKAVTFEVEQTADGVFLQIGEGPREQVSLEEGEGAPLVELQLYVESGGADWRDLAYRAR